MKFWMIFIILLSLLGLYFFNPAFDRSPNGQAAHAKKTSSETSNTIKKPERSSHDRSYPLQSDKPSVGFLAIEAAIKEGDLTRAWKNISDFQAGELEGVWGLLKEADTGHSFFNELYALVAARASALGETDRLLQIVGETLGDGHRRFRVIEYAFHAAKVSPGEMAGLYLGLREEDRNAALSGWARQIATVPSWNDLETFDWTSQPSAVQKALVKGLANRPYSQNRGNVEARSNEIRSVHRFLAELAQREGAISDLVNLGIANLVKELPIESYRVLKSDGYFKKPTPEVVVNQLFKSVTAINPKEGLQLFTEFSSVPAEVASNTFSKALSADSQLAENWFRANKQNLSSQVVDGIVSALAGNEARRQNFQDAWKRIEEISDPEVRSTIEGQIWLAEKSVVKDSAAKDPQGFLESVQSGNADHAEYWIREGFLSWFTQNPGDANRWYSENKSRLTPSQSQHVARAYAEVALGEGDINLARQWADQVVDPNFKQKLVEQIDAAAGQTE